MPMYGDKPESFGDYKKRANGGRMSMGNISPGANVNVSVDGGVARAGQNNPYSSPRPEMDVPGYQAANDRHDSRINTVLGNHQNNRQVMMDRYETAMDRWQKRLDQMMQQARQEAQQRTQAAQAQAQAMRQGAAPGGVMPPPSTTPGTGGPGAPGWSGGSGNGARGWSGPTPVPVGSAAASNFTRDPRVSVTPTGNSVTYRGDPTRPPGRMRMVR